MANGIDGGFDNAVPTGFGVDKNINIVDKNAPIFYPDEGGADLRYNPDEALKAMRDLKTSIGERLADFVNRGVTDWSEGDVNAFLNEIIKSPAVFPGLDSQFKGGLADKLRSEFGVESNIKGKTDSEWVNPDSNFKKDLKPGQEDGDVGGPSQNEPTGGPEPTQ